jgi:hypothetical protein
MEKHNLSLLVGLLILALVLVGPVSAANSIVANEGNSRTAVVGTANTTPPSVIVRDEAGAPIRGVSVTFTVSTGGGSVSPASVTTGNDGTATVTSWTLGTTAGSNTLTASETTPNATMATTSFTFEATGIAGPPTQITKMTGGDLQSATISTAVAIPPSVKVMDAYDNPVGGAVVSFVATPGSSSVSGGSQTTGQDGIATVGGWTLGDVVVTNYLTATTGSHAVVFSAQATESTAAPTISSISPSSGLNTATLPGVTITGTHFSTSGGSVVLTKSGEDNITCSCTGSATSLTCSIPLNDVEDGTWNVVVVNTDGKSVTKSNAFTVYSESGSDVSITSISPATAMAGDSVDFTITGTKFITSMTYEVYLYNSDYSNISADDVDATSTTRMTGTFDLDNDADVDTYKLCIRNEFGSIECKSNAFKITTNAEGTMEIDSSPSGAAIYIDDKANGTTPSDISILVGSHKVTLKKTGYQDWSKMVTVQEDKSVVVDATLYTATTATQATREPTPYPTATPRTTRTTVKSTIKVPTTWAETPATTPASPVEFPFLIGTLCLAFIALRRR